MATLNPALRDFWRKPARNRVLYGGRASSKSWDACGMLVFLASNYKIDVLCVRQIQNKISQSVYKLIRIQIERFGLSDEFHITDNSIKHKGTGSEFSFYGLWRHIDEIKSYEGADILMIEEGHGLTEKQWEILEPTIRKDNSQVWLLFNPGLVTDFAWQRFVVNPLPDSIIRKINYDENPFLSETMLKIIENMKNEDYDRYAHIYLGEPRTDDGSSRILPYAWLQRCLEAFELWHDQIDDNRRHAGLDVAENPDGDKNAFAFRHGPALIDVQRWRPDPEKGPAPRAHALAMEFGVNRLHWDAGGVGAPLKRDFERMREEGRQLPYLVKPFIFGGAVEGPEQNFIKAGRHNSITNKEYFARVNIQAWWSLRMKAENTIKRLNGQDIKLEDCLLINPEIKDKDALLVQLSQPTYQENTSGKLVVDKYGEEGGSPDMGDAVVMAFAYDIRKGLRT